jgi:hypothetical protein
MKRLLVLLAAILACAGLLAGVADAKKKKKIETTVTITNPTPGTYTGKATAAKGCDKSRQVTVWHDTNGNGTVDGEPTDFKIGTAVTDADGNYTVTGNQAPIGDRVIVEVSKERRGRKICKAATASTLASPGSPPGLPY